MLRRIMATSDPKFGMMLTPREADVVGGGAMGGGYGYGTLMHIKSIQLLPDNRSVCEVEATGRFRVLQTKGVDGYMLAKIEV